MLIRFDLFPNGTVQFGLGNILPIPPLYLPYHTSPTSPILPPLPPPAPYHPTMFRTTPPIELSWKGNAVRIEMLRKVLPIRIAK